MGGTLIEHGAVRILFILYFCNEQQPYLPLSEVGDDYTHCIGSESKLQKFDFWLRYPDYLSSAFLKQVERGYISPGKREEVKSIIRHIFASQEPELRWIPMRKYLRGAYEPLDELMAYLSGRKLAYKRVVGWGIAQNTFLPQKEVKLSKVSCKNVKKAIGMLSVANCSTASLVATMVMKFARFNI